MQDPPVSEPERDVRRPLLLAVGDQVARAERAVAHLRRRLLLLVGVPRDQTPEAAVAHVDEPGAVDPALGHPAPEIRRAEIAARLGDGIAFRTRLREPRPRDCPWGMAQRAESDPAGVVVLGSD